jgi:hypothetical protein
MDQRCGYTSGAISVEQARTLNCRIREASYLQLFGSSREVLQGLAALP